MDEHLKINSFLNQIKRRLIKGGNSSDNNIFVKKHKQQKEEQQKNNTEEYFENPKFVKLVLLAENMGLGKDEIEEAFNLINANTAILPKELDLSNVMFLGDKIKYPLTDGIMMESIEKKLLDIQKNFPDLYLAITLPFEFLCKYPKTLSLKKFRKFSYTEILEFSRRCPEEYSILSNMVE